MQSQYSTDPRQAYRDELRRATGTRSDTTARGVSGRRDPGGSDDRSIGDLIKELRDEATDLVRKEVALARTEISEKATIAGRNVAYLVVGGAVAYAGVFVLLIAASFVVTWALIAMGMNGDARYAAYILGPLIIGIIVTIVGGALVQKALSTFRDTERFVPNKTVDSLQENKRWAQSKM